MIKIEEATPAIRVRVFSFTQHTNWNMRTSRLPWSACFLVLIMGSCVLPGSRSMAQSAPSREFEPIPIYHEPAWRLTSRGWQDSSMWRVDLQSLSRPIERIHPILFGVNIVLASLFVLVWCSEEQQVARFLRRPIN